MKAGSPATNPERKPGRPERFDSELKVDDIGEAAVGRQRHLERAGGRGVAIDLRIALVGEQHEVEAPRERDGAGEIAPVGDRALRVRRRAEIERDGPLQKRLVDAVERREVLGGCVALEEDRFGTGGCRCGGIGLIEGIGDQHRRPLDRLFPRQRREDRREQAFARAVKRQHVCLGVDAAGEGGIAAPEPDGDGLAQAPGCRGSAGSGRTRSSGARASVRGTTGSARGARRATGRSAAPPARCRRAARRDARKARRQVRRER